MALEAGPQEELQVVELLPLWGWLTWEGKAWEDRATKRHSRPLALGQAS